MPGRRRLTPEITEHVARIVRAGGTLELAAHMAGVHRRTLLKWLERGDPDSERRSDAPYKALREAVDAARHEREGILITHIDKAARQGSWRAAVYLLERNFPRQPAGPPVDPDNPLGIVDDQLGPDGRPL